AGRAARVGAAEALDRERGRRGLVHVRAPPPAATGGLARDARAPHRLQAEAVRVLRREPGAGRAAVAAGALPPPRVKPAPFDYVAPRTLDEALELRARYAGESAILAGGQSLVPSLNLRLARPAVVIDVNGIAELSGVRAENGTLAIGATTRQRFVERS